MEFDGRTTIQDFPTSFVWKANFENFKAARNYKIRKNRQIEERSTLFSQNVNKLSRFFSCFLTVFFAKLFSKIRLDTWYIEDEEDVKIHDFKFRFQFRLFIQPFQLN